MLLNRGADPNAREPVSDHKHYSSTRCAVLQVYTVVGKGMPCSVKLLLRQQSGGLSSKGTCSSFLFNVAILPSAPSCLPFSPPFSSYFIPSSSLPLLLLSPPPLPPSLSLFTPSPSLPCCRFMVSLPWCWQRRGTAVSVPRCCSERRQTRTPHMEMGSVLCTGKPARTYV